METHGPIFPKSRRIYLFSGSVRARAILRYISTKGGMVGGVSYVCWIQGDVCPIDVKVTMTASSEVPVGTYSIIHSFWVYVELAGIQKNLSCDQAKARLYVVIYNIYMAMWTLWKVANEKMSLEFCAHLCVALILYQ